MLPRCFRRGERGLLGGIASPPTPHEGAGAPHPIRAGGPDLWYQMALVDTTIKQSLISSAGGDEWVC
jgi:hypothetical protein